MNQPTPQPRPPASGMLTVPEIAARLRISRMSVYRIIDTGALRAYRIGRSFRVTRRDFDDYMRAANTRAGETTGGGAA